MYSGNGWTRRSNELSYMPSSSDEEVGLRLAALFHVQDWDMLGDTRPQMGPRGEQKSLSSYFVFIQYVEITTTLSSGFNS